MFIAKPLITSLSSHNHKPGFRVFRFLNFTLLALRLKERSGSVAVDNSEANSCDNSALMGTLEFSIMLFRRNSCMRSPSTPADCE